MTKDVTENVAIFLPTLSFNVMDVHWLCVLDQIRQSTRESHSFSPSEIFHKHKYYQQGLGYMDFHDFSSHPQLSNTIFKNNL